jgi:hypothetical protein
MRPNASVKMQPVGKLLLRATGLPHATGIAKGRLEIAKALVPAMAIHSPCRCLQRALRFLAESALRLT